jgi:transglutaminase-like putative cysteine protease
MTAFSIWHRATYRYRQPVTLGAHRLRLRPRESRAVRIISADLDVTPAAEIHWAVDLFGNAIATANFPTRSDELTIESRILLDHTAKPWPQFDLAHSAIDYPFLYGDDELLDLAALLVPQYADPERRLLSWARGFVRNDPTDTLSLLKDLNAAIAAWTTCLGHGDEGAQPPLVTLDRGGGSCRDIAVLLIEAARRLGFGARIASGYRASRADADSGAAGSTHAWAEIYLPGAGWISFDPTNGTVGDFGLIPVAVARDIHQAEPVSGSFIGPPEDFLGRTVEIAVRNMASWGSVAA